MCRIVWRWSYVSGNTLFHTAVIIKFVAITNIYYGECDLIVCCT
jgi:hypothetical protein